MKVVKADSQEKGGMSILLFHCLFNGDESVTHFLHDVDVGLYKALPNLYAVCIAKTVNKRKTVLGGFMIKTSYNHDDIDFLDTLKNVTTMEPVLANLMGDDTSFLPARITAPVNEHLPEADMLRILVGQQIKFSD